MVDIPSKYLTFPHGETVAVKNEPITKVRMPPRQDLDDNRRRIMWFLVVDFFVDKYYY